jgi:hypothetical protein
MRAKLAEAHRAAPLFFGVMTLASVLVLLVSDAVPRMFPNGAHRVLGALPLALIALAYLFYQSLRRPGRSEVLKAVLLAAAFLFWAANQLWPEAAAATLFNDIAIALFVLDVFFVIAGWPASSGLESFAESYIEPKN